MPTEAVIFDMDREQLVKQTGGRWGAGAQRAMMGMASNEWSAYVRDELEVPLPAEEINSRVVARLIELYRESIPLIDGAVEAVLRAAERWPLAIASSSNRELIDLVIDLAGIADAFEVTVSSEEVGRGKPSPDVFLAAAEQLGANPGHCVVIEDSGNGIRAAVAAEMRVIAVPNREFPPAPDAIDLAHAVVDSVTDITNQLIETTGT
ncbi:MAG: HAD family hydrolase [Solirubrobacterales bacterium]